MRRMVDAYSTSVPRVPHFKPALDASLEGLGAMCHELHFFKRVSSHRLPVGLLARGRFMGGRDWAPESYLLRVTSVPTSKSTTTTHRQKPIHNQKNWQGPKDKKEPITTAIIIEMAHFVASMPPNFQILDQFRRPLRRTDRAFAVHVYVRIRWRTQKNPNNGETKLFA